MLVLVTLTKIRRDRLINNKSIRSITINRGVSRNSVSKVLRSEETSLESVLPIQALHSILLVNSFEPYEAFAQ